MNDELVSFSERSTHQSQNCYYVLNNGESELFDELPYLESELSEQIMANIVHIAGYPSQKSPSEIEGETYHYYERHGSSTNSLT